MKDKTKESADTIQIKRALDKVIKSSTFEDVHRLRTFLEYVVTEALSDRRKKIPAKIIAADVYNRQSGEAGDPEAIVRVDAGRLRRRLELYYATEGVSDQVVISIPKGGYTPTFDLVLAGTAERATKPEPQSSTERVSSMNLVVLVAVGCIAFLIGWMANRDIDGSDAPVLAAIETPSFDPNAEVRLSISQVSSASLLARTFVEEARHLTFPSIDPARPMAAEILCKRAIEMAPDLAMGHSCDAYIQAFFAFLLPPGQKKEARLENARREVESALRIDPADPHSLMSAAWLQFSEGQRSEAVEKAATALNLDVNQSFLRNFYGMMMVFESRGVELLASGLRNLPDEKADDLYHPFIVAAAKLQAQDYGGVIEAVEKAVALEGRTSQLTTAIQIAALENSEETAEAEDLAQNMYETWKIQDVRGPLKRLYSNGSDVDAIAVPVEAVFARVGLQLAQND